jgi:hypothetical protein
MSKPILLNIPDHLLDLIDERLQAIMKARQPGDYSRVTRTSVTLGLLYQALNAKPTAFSAEKPKRTTKW